MTSKLGVDPDVDVVWNYYKHLFPEFTVNHARVYKLLWRVEPIAGENISEFTEISKTTVYRVLHDLCSAGLVEKTNFKPIGYYAINPLKSYNSNLKQILKKLEKGAEIMQKLVENSTSLSGELYLVKRDGGQQRLLMKQNRALLNDTKQLLEIRKVIDEQIKEVDKQKLRPITAYR
jgi:sugar-specific transcriptional regulator TrmB